MENISEENVLFYEFITNNDEKSFLKLYNLTHPWLYKVIYHIVPQKEVAKDIFQEAWYNAINYKNKFNPNNGSINNLLYTIAKNLALQHLKKGINSNTYYQEDFSGMFNVFNNSTPESELLETEKFGLLKKAVLKIPEKYQDVIILFYYANLSIQEIAIKLLINENTIKTLLSRGKKKLEVELQKLGYQN